CVLDCRTTGHAWGGTDVHSHHHSTSPGIGSRFVVYGIGAVAHSIYSLGGRYCSGDDVCDPGFPSPDSANRDLAEPGGGSASSVSDLQGSSFHVEPGVTLTHVGSELLSPRSR